MKVHPENQIHIIIQARTGSTRLPCKVLRFLDDKMVIDHVVERLQRSLLASKVIVATTNEKQDDIIEDICRERKFPYYRGSEKDVLRRYYETAKQFQSDIIVRVTSDCPLVDPHYIDLMIQYFLQHNLDYVGPKYVGNHNFPDGFNGEVFRFSKLKEAYKKADAFQREHVTTYLIKHYKVKEFIYPINYDNYKIDFSKLHLSLDTSEDYLLLQKIFRNVYSLKPYFTLEDVLDYLNDNLFVLQK